MQISLHFDVFAAKIGRKYLHYLQTCNKNDNDSYTFALIWYFVHIFLGMPL